MPYSVSTVHENICTQNEALMLFITSLRCQYHILRSVAIHFFNTICMLIMVNYICTNSLFTFSYKDNLQYNILHKACANSDQTHAEYFPSHICLHLMLFDVTKSHIHVAH